MPIRKLHEIIDKVERIDRLVRRRSSPQQISASLNISLATWYNYLQVLREDFDFPIVFCSKTKRYYYEEEGRFVCKFTRTSSGPAQMSQQARAQVLVNAPD